MIKICAVNFDEFQKHAYIDLNDGNEEEVNGNYAFIHNCQVTGVYGFCSSNAQWYRVTPIYANDQTIVNKCIIFVHFFPITVIEIDISMFLKFIKVYNTNFHHVSVFIPLPYSCMLKLHIACGCRGNSFEYKEKMLFSLCTCLAKTQRHSCVGWYKKENNAIECTECIECITCSPVCPPPKKKAR